MNVQTAVDHNLPAQDDPWYRQGIMPMVVAIPALTVIAGLSTVWIANHHADPQIEDAQRPDIIAMHADPVPDAYATRIGVTGELVAAGGRLRIELRTPAGGAPRELRVVFAHASKETFDQTAEAQLTEPGVYETATPALVDGNWYVEVSPDERTWRLTGQMQSSASPVHLRPHGTR